MFQFFAPVFVAGRRRTVGCGAPPLPDGLSLEEAMRRIKKSIDQRLLKEFKDGRQSKVWAENGTIVVYIPTLPDQCIKPQRSGGWPVRYAYASSM